METLLYQTKSLDYNKIKRIAESILLENHVTLPPVPIKDIIEKSGLIVHFVKFKEMRNKVAGFTDFAGETIYINTEDSLNRQTFTMAHEYGHWILHRSLFKQNTDEYQVLLRTGLPTSNPLEKEANAFAANLLVPEFLLKPVKDIAFKSQLSRMFGVSDETIQYRLQYV